MTPQDHARSLGHRLRNSANERGLAVDRLRRHLVFQRLLARLALTDEWVLKGGFCVEVRLTTAHARATKDLDVALVRAVGAMTSLDVQDRLELALEADPDGDGFTFDIGLPRGLAEAELGNSGWRVTVTARVDGQRFEAIKLDVVARPDEVDGGVEVLLVPPVLEGIGHAPVAMPAVDIAQHAAEKAHAYARLYAYERASSRVKDLVDLVLFIESGLLDPAAWGTRLTHVFMVRSGAAPPAELPEPPQTWTVP